MERVAALFRRTRNSENCTNASPLNNRSESPKQQKPPHGEGVSKLGGA